MKKPFIIPDALDTTKGGEFDQVWEELNPENSPWTLSNYSARGENMNVMWIKNDYCCITNIESRRYYPPKDGTSDETETYTRQNTYKWSDKGTGK